MNFDEIVLRTRWSFFSYSFARYDIYTLPQIYFSSLIENGTIDSKTELRVRLAENLVMMNEPKLARRCKSRG